MPYSLYPIAIQTREDIASRRCVGAAPSPYLKSTYERSPALLRSRSLTLMRTMTSCSRTRKTNASMRTSTRGAEASIAARSSLGAATAVEVFERLRPLYLGANWYRHQRIDTIITL